MARIFSYIFRFIFIVLELTLLDIEPPSQEIQFREAIKSYRGLLKLIS